MSKICDVCPRNCNVNRATGLGFCGASDTVKISKVMLHHYEEPTISGEENSQRGSGAIFFSNCSLKCCYCQNSEISSGGVGKEISTTKLAEIFKKLEDAGAFNINLVTPTHFTEQIIKALDIYRPNIPVIWNTSGYEKPETIEKLKSYVDVYLTDFKYFDEKFSTKYSSAKDYAKYCKSAILKMRENQPEDVIIDGFMKKGVIIRHLVLPTLTKDSEKIIEWIYENLGNSTIISLMSQYVPMANANKYPEINRKITKLEYKILVNKLNKMGFKNVFVQEFDSASCTYTPDFSYNDDVFDC